MPSLAAFDRAYLDNYPCLLERLRIDAVTGKEVLEVELGNGTLSQQFAFEGVRYSGPHVVSGPVRMVNHRLKVVGPAGRAVRGSMLKAPIEDASQDIVVSIGCFRHTVDVQRSIDETYRALRPGGSVCVMAYNGLSHRQWLGRPRVTLSLLRAGSTFAGMADTDRRRAHDANLAGDAASETGRHFDAGKRIAWTSRYCHGGYSPAMSSCQSWNRWPGWMSISRHAGNAAHSGDRPETLSVDAK